MFLDKIKQITENQLVKQKSARANITEIFRQNRYNFIAEIKKASPSRGEIAPNADIAKIAKDYATHGATAISVLTEPQFFKGDIDYLRQIRQISPNAILLRKDFIIDAYQIYEAKLAGAEMILLILALTGAEKTAQLIQIAKDIGLEVLLEVHTEQEMKTALTMRANFVGVNNRNLKTLQVSLDVARSLSKYICKGKIFVCESGLQSAQEIQEMANLGYSGFLIGSHLMQADSPGEELKKLIKEVQND